MELVVVEIINKKKPTRYRTYWIHTKTFTQHIVSLG